MSKRVMKLILLALLLLSPWDWIPAVHPLVARAAGQQSTRVVFVLETQGVINPFTAQYIARVLALASQRDAHLAVIQLNTPGGLESATRDIVRTLLDAPLPTVVYVSPPGARATSAGLFITLAADVAAMAPATHIGAAHPVPLGSEASEVMNEKMTSDAVAWVRGIADLRGRNADWAADAVRENLSVIASEALELGVVDLVAEDLDDLLRQLDGRTVGAVTLRTADALLERQAMNLLERLLHVITDPNIAYLLLSLGLYFFLAELAEPGLTVAGIAGVVSFVIAFVALGSLPVNWAGVGLLFVSAILFVIGLLTDTEVVVSVAAVGAFILGSLFLFSPLTPTSPAAPDLRVSPWLIGVMTAGALGFSLVVLRAILKAVRLPPRAGAQRLVGQTGVARTDLRPGGQVRVGLEEWSAVAVDGEIDAGDTVRVVGVSGVRLQVVPAGQEPVGRNKESIENQGGV